MFWILIFLAAVVPSAIAHPVDAQDSGKSVNNNINKLIKIAIATR